MALNLAKAALQSTQAQSEPAEPLSFSIAEALQQATIRVSMSRLGNCWDNAVAESFFGTIKTELIHPIIFSTQTVARTVIAEWIEVFYNRQRLHSTLGYLSPVQFEDNYWRSLEGVKAA